MVHRIVSVATVEIDRALERARLEQFLKLMVPIAVGFVVVYALVAVVWHSWVFIVAALQVVAYLVALHVARQRTAQGHLQEAATIIAYALALLTLVGAPLLPWMLPGLLFIPMAGVAMVIPYVSGKPLRRLLIVNLAVETVVLGGGLWAPRWFAAPPVWLQNVLTTLAAVSAIGLTFLLLWLDSERLRTAAARNTELYDRAQEAVRVREAFLAIASHELRTPLMPLQMQLQMLGREAASGRVADDVAVRRIGTAVRQVAQLTHLVDDLLDTTRMASGQLLLERRLVDLAALAGEVAARFKPQLDRLGCALELHLDAQAFGLWDALRLDQVISNLLSNAMKYGAGKPIVMRVDSTDGWGQLVVRDAGIGIPLEHQALIFERFARVAPPERHVGGLGLGLWIVRQIVDSLGGTIQVHSVPGQGATFTVRLPSGELPRGTVTTGLRGPG